MNLAQYNCRFGPDQFGQYETQMVTSSVALNCGDFCSCVGETDNICLFGPDNNNDFWARTDLPSETVDSCDLEWCMCDTHYEIAREIEKKGIRFQEHIAMRIAGTVNWTDYLDDQTFSLNDQEKVADYELYGIYVAQDSEVTFTIEAPSPGEGYSWFVSKTCGAILQYEMDWNPELIETVYYEPVETPEEEEPVVEEEATEEEAPAEGEAGEEAEKEEDQEPVTEPATEPVPEPEPEPEFRLVTVQEVCDDCVTTKTFKLRAVEPNAVCTFSLAWDLREKTGAKLPLTSAYYDWDWQNAANVIQIPIVVLGREGCDLDSHSCIEHVEPNVDGAAALIGSALASVLLYILF